MASSDNGNGNNGKHPGGRPTKLTPERQEKIVNAIAAGNFFVTAAAYAGIDYETFRAWILRGEKTTSGKYYEFQKAVKDAEARCETAIVAQWRKHVPDNWIAGAAFLERRYPDRWKRRDSREVTGPRGGPLEFTLLLGEASEDGYEEDGENGGTS